MAEGSAAPFGVMTFNIRFDTRRDGRNRWRRRRRWVGEIVARSDLAGLQEARRNQVRDLERRLPGYDWFGAGRRDGVSAGEHVPVFWRRSRFDRADGSVFWLSSTPDLPGSRDHPEAITRIATWVRLIDREEGSSVFVFNTHLDHRVAEARRDGVRQLLGTIERIAGEEPVILMGDFNAKPPSDTYALVTGGEAGGPSLLDARAVSEAPYEGPDCTLTSFTAITPGRRIDYVFVNDRFRVLTHATLDEQRRGRFPSDHLPVLATLQRSPAGP